MGLMGASFSRATAAFALLMVATAQGSAQERDASESQFRKFADAHCVGCHGPDLQRAKLRLDTLPLTLADKDAAATWTKVFDRVTRGEMPPRSKERPPEKDTNEVLAELN